MKKFLLTLPLLGLTFAGCEQKPAPPSASAEPTMAQKAEMAAKQAAEKTKEVALDVKDAVATKLTEWKLTPADIKADLEQGGRVVREKTAAAGERAGAMFDNAKAVTAINARLLTDPKLSALKINVDADQGVVTLKGTVESPELIGRAIALALDTDGVTRVVSLLTVAP
jgi:hypothetical protein